MSKGDALPDPNWDEFDPNAELDYEEDDGDDQGREEVAESSGSYPTGDPQEPCSSRSNRVASGDLPVPPVEREVVRNIGPSLPPGFLLGDDDEAAPEDPEDPSASPRRGEDIGVLPNMPSGSSGPRIYGPMIPQRPQSPPIAQIGPAMPPNFSAGPSLPEEDHNDNDGNSLGPPPEPSQARVVLGPAMPPGFLNGASFDPEPEDADIYGPALPGAAKDVDVPEDEEDDDDFVVGPMLPGPGGDDQAAEEYARRRIALEEAKEAAKNTSQREEWMLQLPQKLTNYGLGARTFSKGGGAEKDSSWTETPQQKRLKLQNASSEPSTSTADVAAAAQRARDKEQEKIAQELNKNRKEALLDTYMKKRKEPATNGSSSSGGRRAFDREKDMEVRGFSGNATSEEIKKKCGNLGARFGSSGTQKFL